MIEADSEVNGAEFMVTVSAAAKILGVTPCRVHQFIGEGRLRAQKLSPRMYVLDIRDVNRLAQIPRRSGRKSKKSA